MKRIAIYNPNLNTMGGGEKVCLALAETLRNKAQVILVTHHTVKLNKLEAYFGTNLDGVQIEVIKKSRLLRRIYENKLVPDALSRLIRDLELYRKFKKRNYDVFVNNAYNTELPSPSQTGIYMCMFPHKILDPTSMSFIKRSYIRSVRFAARILMCKGRSNWLATYQVITANSAFTQRYITEYWGRGSDILYPICDAIEGTETKQKKILNVGRFFHNNGITHHKRQDFLVDVFKKMEWLQKDGWELHFVGTVNENFHDMLYVIDLMKRAEGYPIYFHFGASLERLQSLYRQASIYWHATGYGVSAKKFPERQEHFGISTVEAMSAGAVPVVINTAGQQEVVTDGADGFLWSTEHELEAKTRTVLTLIEPLSQRARETAKQYDRAAFVKCAREIFNEYL